MKKLIILSVVMIILAGCGPKPEVEYAGTVYPVDLKVEVNHERMDLSWRTVGDGAISGYHIYISPEPLAAGYPGPEIDASVPTYNVTPFPGDTDPDDGIENFEATQLENGVRYFVTVRIVYPDQTVSRPSNEVVAVCGAKGDIELTVRYQSEQDGYSFELNKYVRADAIENDLYFFSKDGVDYLASPKRLDGFIRDTRFVVLPYRGSLKEVLSRVGDAELSGDTDQVEVSIGDWILLFCEGHSHAYVNVKGLEGTAKDRRVKLFFAYSALAEELWP